MAKDRAYVKYDAVGIVAIVCAGCVTERERELVNARPVGLVPIRKSGVVVCDRCGKDAE